jgi:hypothetical protein
MPPLPTFESEAIELPPIPGISLPSNGISLTNPLSGTTALTLTNPFSGTVFITGTSMISRTAGLTYTVSVTGNAWVSSTAVIANGWISSTSETLAWIQGDSITGTRPISAAYAIAENIALPVSVMGSMQLYIPNLWPYIVVLLLMLAWVMFTLSAKFAVALFGVLYRLVDTLIRWFIPFLG